MLLAVSFILVLPFILASHMEKIFSQSDIFFITQGQLLSLIPGRFGCFLRAAYYFGSLESCSLQIHIGFCSFFSNRSASVGSYVSTGSFCVIGKVSIKDSVMIASRVSITSGKRQHLNENGEICLEPRYDCVSIGEKSWIGEGAIIIADVGSGCIVSAGAVVTTKMPDRCVIAGNPAKIIRRLGSAVEEIVY